MTKLPYLLEMDPGQWLEAVDQEAEELARELTDALNESGSAEELVEAMEPLLEPYFIDPEDPTKDELRAVLKAGYVFAGQEEGGQWMRLEHDDEGVWWVAGEDRPDESAQDIHSALARRIVESVDWGDPERARERANTQRAKRAIMEPFLEAVDAAGGREASAGEVREALKELVNSCLPAEGFEVDDQSPDEESTHLVIRLDGEEWGHVFGVGPGASRAPERLEERFGRKPEFDEGVRMVTDHLRFMWPPFANTKSASSDVILPSEKDEENVVDYYFAIDRAVSLTLRALNVE